MILNNGNFYFSVPPPPELVKRGNTSAPFYSDMRVMVPLIIAILALLGAGTAAGLCWRNSKSQSSLQQLSNTSRSSVTLLVELIDVPTLVPEQARPLKESLDNQQNAEAQRERYYATIHKVALQAGGDKIPGNAIQNKHLEKQCRFLDNRNQLYKNTQF